MVNLKLILPEDEAVKMGKRDVYTPYHEASEREIAPQEGIDRCFESLEKFVLYTRRQKYGKVVAPGV